MSTIQQIYPKPHDNVPLPTVGTPLLREHSELIGHVTKVEQQADGSTVVTYTLLPGVVIDMEVKESKEYEF